MFDPHEEPEIDDMPQCYCWRCGRTRPRDGLGRFTAPGDPDLLELQEQAAGLERWGIRTDGQGRRSDPAGAVVSATVVAVAVGAAVAGFIIWALS